MPGNGSITALLERYEPGRALDQRFYVDDEVYELELRRILLQQWFMAGHVSQIPAAGDYIVARMDRETAIVIRGNDGVIRAFANVCRHRGSLICLEDRGSVKKLTCPYHGWMYDLEGNLVAARSMNGEFERSNYNLLPVALEDFGGFLFVSFSDNPLSFSSARKALAEPMRVFGFDNLQVAAKKSYPIDANWKLALENYMECYHCSAAHPDYAKMHTLTVDPERSSKLQKRMHERMANCGIPNLTIGYDYGSTPAGQVEYAYSRTALFEGYLTGSRGGEPVAPLLGDIRDWDGGASDWMLGPLTYLLAYSDHIVAYVFTSTGSRTCNCDLYWLVRGDASEGADYDAEELTWLWDVTTEADKEIIVNNWKGINSRYYRPGPFSRMESSENVFVQWLVDELSGPET